MKGRDTFTMAVIKELKQLFMQKDKADYNEQKSIRRKIRKKRFGAWQFLYAYIMAWHFVFAKQCAA